MKRLATALFLNSIFVIGGCNTSGLGDYGTEDEIESGTLLVQTSFEGSMLPFRHEHDGADIFTDPTAPDGTRVLRFTYPPGHPSGYSTDLAWVWFEQGYHEVKVEYYFKYSENFFFHRVANKQLYVDVGDKTNFVISAVDANSIGGVGINTELLIGCQDNNINITELKTPNMANVTICSNNWYKVTLYFKLNKDGRRDGHLKLWVNNIQIMDYSDIKFNAGNDANKPFTGLKFDPVWGGVGGPKPDITDYFYVDAVKIWVGPFKSDNH
jgi:hypothetical protein